MELREKQKKTWTDVSKSQCALKSKADRLKIYRTDDDKPDHKTVNEIIKRKTTEGLWEEDPDVPGHYLYYARDKTTFAATHANSRELTLDARTKLDKTAAAKLTGKGGMFGDDAAGVAKKGLKTLEAPTRTTSAASWLTSKALKAAGSAAAAGASGDGSSAAVAGKGGGKVGKGGKDKKAKELKAKTPVEKARDLAGTCLEDSAKARTL